NFLKATLVVVVSSSSGGGGISRSSRSCHGRVSSNTCNGSGRIHRGSVSNRNGSSGSGHSCCGSSRDSDSCCGNVGGGCSCIGGGSGSGSGSVKDSGNVIDIVGGNGGSHNIVVVV
ncbi:hypothetical protein Tco_0376032, partial [Tanacetum coccineum]